MTYRVGSITSTGQCGRSLTTSAPLGVMASCRRVDVNMFRGQGLGKPQGKSLLGALIVTVLVMLGSLTSPVFGYFFALSALVMIIVAMHMGSIWPTQSRKENSLVFSLFWGLMIGALVPFFVTTFLDGGLSAVYEIFTRKP